MLRHSTQNLDNARPPAVMLAQGWSCLDHGSTLGLFIAHLGYQSVALVLGSSKTEPGGG